MTLRLIANTIKGKKEVVHFAARPRFLLQEPPRRATLQGEREEGSDAAEHVIVGAHVVVPHEQVAPEGFICLLYTSDAADD